MQVAVLNGVNLDVLAQRDPELYVADLASYGELETRIYGWARELEFSARCFQTNHEGQFVECVMTHAVGERADRQSGRLEPLQLCDQDALDLRCPGGRGSSLEYRRA